MKTAYTPAQYAEKVWGGAVTPRTIRNWIENGKALKGVSRVESTPAGRYVIFMQDEHEPKALSLVEMMKSKAS